MKKNEIIGIKLDGVVKPYKFTRDKVNVPQFGILTIADAAMDPNVIKKLLDLKSPALVAVVEEETDSLADVRKQYEELTGKKSGNKKIETLQAEIEKFKSKT